MFIKFHYIKQIPVTSLSVDLLKFLTMSLVPPWQNIYYMLKTTWNMSVILKIISGEEMCKILGKYALHIWGKVVHKLFKRNDSPNGVGTCYLNTGINLFIIMIILTKKLNHRKINLQANVTDKHRPKTPQQNTSKLNTPVSHISGNISYFFAICCCCC